MNLRIFLATVFVIALLPNCTLGQSAVSDPNNQSLRGVKAITVVVGNVRTISLPVNSKPDTPTAEEVKTEAEFWLKKFGINVVSSGENQRFHRFIWYCLPRRMVMAETITT